MLPKDDSIPNEVKLNLRDENDNISLGLESPVIAKEKEILEKEKDNLIVPEKLTKPHILIQEYKNKFAENKWTGNAKTLRTYGDVLNISATAENMNRALRIMDTFIKVIENRGHKIINRNRKTYIIIEGEDIELTLREQVKRIPKEKKDEYDWRNYDYISTGLLQFTGTRFSHRNEISDGKQPIEKQLAKFIAKLEIRGHELCLESIEREKRWAIEREIERINEELKKRKEKELEEFKNLLKKTRHWHEARIIREYINGYESYVRKANLCTGEIEKWITWAKKKADWYDPFVNSHDELLNDEDKKKLDEDHKQSHGYNNWNPFRNY
jgi:hypothetical protein